MASGKGRLLNLMGGLVLKEVEVLAVVPLSAHFLRIDAQGEGLDKVGFQAGDKTQLLLPDQDVRTYTPFAWGNGRVSFLVYLHKGVAGGMSPGPRWGRGVKVADKVRFIGPQRSLVLPPGPAVLVGDETSIAVALAYAQARPGQVRALIEASDPAEVESVTKALGLTGVRVTSREANHRQYGILGEWVQQALTELPGATVGLTGGTPLIQGVREQLKTRGLARPTTKAYWAPGKTGLD